MPIVTTTKTERGNIIPFRSDDEVSKQIEAIRAYLTTVQGHTMLGRVGYRYYYGSDRTKADAIRHAIMSFKIPATKKKKK